LGLDKHPPWQAGVHFYASDGAAPDFVEKAHQADDLIAHDEVVEAEFWPRGLLPGQLHVPDGQGPRIEYGLGVADLQVFDPAVVDRLA